jgi:hypothetical protein
MMRNGKLTITDKIILRSRELYLRVIPFRYVNDNYRDSFVSKREIAPNRSLAKAEEVIYGFWTGTNELSENRKRGLELMRKNAGVEVRLVTPRNLDTYILPEYPLHPAYEYLSLVHKADYLRCYFMLHHGGGYSDVKPCFHSWKRAFAQLNRSDRWCLGYREKFGGTPRIEGKIGEDINWYYSILIGMGSFIFKPYSSIAQEWMEELHHRLDLLLPDLKSHPGNVLGDNEGYPVAWSFILAQILHPILLKYHRYLIQNNDIRPQFHDYR